MKWIFSGIVALLFSQIFVSSSFAKTEAGECGPGNQVTAEEKLWLIESVRHSLVGRELISAYLKKYKTFKKLKIFWDEVSYSQLGSAQDPSQQIVCIRLAKKLPDIEHIADFAHELTHATRLSQNVLTGRVETAAEFVDARLGAEGGEADAFATECIVKRDLLGRWDELCSPYIDTDSTVPKMNQGKILSSLRDGTLSASLTGEPYPRMLARQFQMLSETRAQRAPASSGKK